MAAEFEDVNACQEAYFKVHLVTSIPDVFCQDIKLKFRVIALFYTITSFNLVWFFITFQLVLLVMFSKSTL